VFFKRNSKNILFMDNAGQTFEMYCWNDDSYENEYVETFEKVSCPVLKVDIEEYLLDQESEKENEN